eukprot:6905045-Prymnesium_polylepis.1
MGTIIQESAGLATLLHLSGRYQTRSRNGASSKKPADRRGKMALGNSDREEPNRSTRAASTELKWEG